MKTGSKFGKSVAIAYWFLIALLILFLGYIAVKEGVEEHFYRADDRLGVYTEPESEIVVDPSAPIGVKKQYFLYPQKGDTENAHLCFYVVHSYAQVYVGNELIYSMKASEKNRFLHSPGCKWVMVPLRREDAGKKITVVVMPVYKAVLDRGNTFYIGSQMEVYTNRLKVDLPQILVGLFTIVIGLVLSAVTLKRYWENRADTANGYLGMFTFLAGLWKLTDCSFISLALGDHTMALSAISLSALSCCLFPFMNYMRKQIRSRKFHILEFFTVLAVIAEYICFILQIFRVLELRQSLHITHVAIVSGLIPVILISITALIYEKKNTKIQMTAFFLLLCTIGAVADMIVYYISGNSTKILFVAVAFLSYIIFVIIHNNIELNRRANRDLFTGFYNRSCCNELLSDEAKITVPSAFVMMDLNDLKALNDSAGHEMGDRMIMAFTDIVKAEALPGAFLGRYGGDEFIMFINDISKKDVETMMHRIRIGVQMHNAAGMQPEISFSYGCAYSEDMDKPGIMEMFKKADEKMYIEKKKYHEAHDTPETHKTQDTKNIE
ncbi:MAG: diguanylate cyclase [Lachnospiraceae bacterium]|nr:diguanylate cyclase [Lachnospiraceae bacterium]